MFTESDQISTIWSTSFLNCSRVLKSFSPFVSQRSCMVEFFLQKHGYVDFYRFARDYTQKIRKVQVEKEEELFDFAATLHEDPAFQDKLVSYLNDTIQTSYKYLSATSLTIDKELLNLLCREDLNDGLSLYSAITELIKKEFNDAKIIRIKKQTTIFSELAKKIYTSYSSTYYTSVSTDKKYKKIMDAYKTQLSKSVLCQPNEDRTKSCLQKLMQIKYTTIKHYRGILCYDLLDDVHSHLLEKDMNDTLYSTYLFYIYLIKKIVEHWLGNFLSNKDTLIGASHLPDLLHTMMEVNKDYHEMTKSHPKIARKSNSQRELDRKSAGVTSDKLYETINL